MVEASGPAMIRGDQSDRKEMRVQNTALPGSAIFSFTFLLGMPHGRWGTACARNSRVPDRCRNHLILLMVFSKISIRFKDLPLQHPHMQKLILMLAAALIVGIALGIIIGYNLDMAPILGHLD